MYVRVCVYIYIQVTSRMIAGSIPYGVIGIFHCHNPSGTRDISWVVKAAGT